MRSAFVKHFAKIRALRYRGRYWTGYAISRTLYRPSTIEDRMEHHIRFDADAMTLYLLDQRALPGR